MVAFLVLAVSLATGLISYNLLHTTIDTAVLATATVFAGVTAAGFLLVSKQRTP